MNIIENLGFDFVTESEDTFMGFLAKICEDGKPDIFRPDGEDR